MNLAEHMSTRTFACKDGTELEVELEEASMVSGSGSDTDDDPSSEPWTKAEIEEVYGVGGDGSGNTGKGNKAKGGKGKGEKGKGEKGKGDKGTKGNAKGVKGNAGKGEKVKQEHQPGKKMVFDINSPEDAHKLRQCKACGAHDLWRRMEYHYETVCTTDEAAERQGTMAEKDDLRTGKQYGNYTYTCAKCVSERDKITLQEAHRQIKQPRTNKSIARSQAFEHALKNVQETFIHLLVHRLREHPRRHIRDIGRIGIGHVGKYIRGIGRIGIGHG